jgi:hypothetical protein
MARIDFTRDKTNRRALAHQRSKTGIEIQHQATKQTADVLKGMGKGRYSRAADQFMGAEPIRRIDPNSPEGRAIAAKLGL